MTRLEMYHIFLLFLTLVKSLWLVYSAPSVLSTPFYCFWVSVLSRCSETCSHSLWEQKNKVNCLLTCSAFRITIPPSQFWGTSYSKYAILIGRILTVLASSCMLFPQLSDRDSYCTIPSCHFQSNFGHIRVRTARLGWFFFSGNMTTCFPVYGLSETTWIVP